MLLARTREAPIELTIDAPDGTDLQPRIVDTDISDGLFNALYEIDDPEGLRHQDYGSR